MRIGSKPIEFDVYADENLPMYLMGDELRVKQILNNILSNAFKYTEKGVVKMSVTSREGEDENTEVLTLTVSDTGQGMSKEQVNALFDEYARFNMEANRTTEGTGLGMSITRNLIRMMNGSIKIDSVPGEGTVFTVDLPQGKMGPERLGKESADNLHLFRTAGKSQQNKTPIVFEPMPYGSVLVVDDVETNIYVAMGLMNPYGLKMDSVCSGYDALEKIKQKNVYDIVFMDHMMPKMDGIETTKKIRHMGYKGNIVALTANAVAGQAEVFYANGFNDFISKPIDTHRLDYLLKKNIRDVQPPEVLEEARKHALPAAEEPAGVHPKVMESFLRDAKKSLAVLDEIMAKETRTTDDDHTYVIYVHGMKSALANVGQPELSAVALKLEQAGRAENKNLIDNETPAFLARLRAFMDGLTLEGDETAGDKTADGDAESLREQLDALKTACENYDGNAADDIMAELSKKTWDKKTKELLDLIAEHLLHSEFEEITEAIDTQPTA
jgi:CheY-like chemotaxis protein